MGQGQAHQLHRRPQPGAAAVTQHQLPPPSAAVTSLESFDEMMLGRCNEAPVPGMGLFICFAVHA